MMTFGFKMVYKGKKRKCYLSANSLADLRENIFGFCGNGLYHTYLISSIVWLLSYSPPPTHDTIIKILLILDIRIKMKKKMNKTLKDFFENRLFSSSIDYHSMCEEICLI